MSEGCSLAGKSEALHFAKRKAMRS